MPHDADTAHFRTDEAFAHELDAADPRASTRELFHIPKDESDRPLVYMVGNSLGLMPRATAAAVQRELEDWAALAVEAHTRGRDPWLPYHESLREPAARLVGALPGEVVTMNSLTVNLHLLMVSFYRPTRERFKIIIEDTAFPSDSYAVASQVRFHGFDPREALVRIRPSGTASPERSEEPWSGSRSRHPSSDAGNHGFSSARGLASGEAVPPAPGALTTDAILAVIEREGPRTALVMLGAVNYLTGQWFEMERITAAARRHGCVVGWDLAHAAGNVPMKLHDWDVDFAAWCTYKYLNAGPGAAAGAFVHERHARSFDLPRFTGWWGNEPATRFKMGPTITPQAGAEGWQLSNPPILSMAPLKVSMEIFDRVGMAAIREKSVRLTGYLEWLLEPLLAAQKLQIVTPREPAQRGAQLSLRLQGLARDAEPRLRRLGVLVDFREPDIIRAAPAPLYNSFHDVWRLAQAIRSLLA